MDYDVNNTKASSVALAHVICCLMMVCDVQTGSPDGSVDRGSRYPGDPSGGHKMFRQ